MTFAHRTRHARIGAAASAIAVLVTLAGCSADDATDNGAAASNGAASHADAPGEAAGLPAVPAEAGHVHGMALNPGDGRLYLGTHAGTMVLDGDTITRVGDTTIDLMGFTATGPDHFYASGHPGPDDDLPNPVGLIESTDGGQTWRSLSLAGESDFHTLGAAGTQVYGFNGQLVTSNGGTDWATGAADVAPVSLAVDPSDPGRVVATTEHGPMASEDEGATFTHLETAPLLVFVAWPDTDSLWGVGVDGAVYRSGDAGATWEQHGTVGAAPASFTAAEDGTVAVATEDQILTSTDGGRTFAPVATYSAAGH
jgi:hypothetical protein